MRIAHLIGTLAERDGGPTRVCLDMATATAALGHQVEIHTTDLGIPPDTIANGPTVTHGDVPVHYHRARLGGVWRFSPDLWRAIHDTAARVDLVHIHSFYLFHDLAGWRACREISSTFAAGVRCWRRCARRGAS